MPDTTTTTTGGTSMDPTLIFGASMARLNEIGNLSIQQATENSGRLSAMFGVRAAQANPIEASSIADLKQASTPGNQGANALVGALAAILANLAHVTPATKAPPTQAKT
jgi:hypothetical protein